MTHYEELIFFPTYNEKENITGLVSAIVSQSAESKLLVVDDNSPDGTGELLEQLSTESARLTVIHRPKKLGIGSAHQLAMLYAIRNGFRLLVTMDADFSHDPAAIPSLVSMSHKCDFVIGSRYMQGGRTDMTGNRKRASAVANKLARFLLKIPLHELTTSFRVYRVDLLRRLDFGRIQSGGYSFFFEVVHRIAELGADCREIPIHFQERKSGGSKIPRSQIFLSGLVLIRLWLETIFGFRQPPFRFQEPRRECISCGSPYLVEKRTGAWFRRATERGQRTRVRCLCCGASAKGVA